MKNLAICLLCIFGCTTLSVHAQEKKMERRIDVSDKTIKEQTKPREPLAIHYPKNNQKVRGEYQITGIATAGSTVKIQISSSYYKIAYDSQQKRYKGAWPFARINRTYTVKADRAGRWAQKGVELWNAGWEETYTIKATANGKSVAIQVYDNTRPVTID